MHLSFDERGVQHPAAVIDRHVPHESHLAGLGVHLHHGDVRAERERGAGLAVDALGAQPRLPSPVAALARRAMRRRARRARGTGSGAPRTANPPPSSQLEVDRVGLEQMRRQRARPLEHLAAALEHRRSARLQRARAPRARPPLHESRVGVHHPDRLDRHPEHPRSELRERRLVALPVRRGPRHHGDRAVRVRLDRGELLGAERRDLDVGGEADAQGQVIAPFPAGGSLGAKGVDPGEPLRLAQRALVLTDVVHGARRRPVGERVARDQVPASHVERVHAELGGDEVDRALDQRGGLGPAGPPVRRDRASRSSRRCAPSRRCAGSCRRPRASRGSCSAGRPRSGRRPCPRSGPPADPRACRRVERRSRRAAPAPVRG